MERREGQILPSPFTTSQALLEIPLYLLSWLHPTPPPNPLLPGSYLLALLGTGWKLAPIPGSGQSGVAYPQICLGARGLDPGLDAVS